MSGNVKVVLKCDMKSGYLHKDVRTARRAACTLRN